MYFLLSMHTDVLIGIIFHIKFLKLLIFCGLIFINLIKMFNLGKFRNFLKQCDFENFRHFKKLQKIGIEIEYLNSDFFEIGMNFIIPKFFEKIPNLSIPFHPKDTPNLTIRSPMMLGILLLSIIFDICPIN